MDDSRTFREGVLGGRDSVKDFRVEATDGGAGRVSWATYEPGDSYLVVTTGRLRKAHRVLPAGAVAGVGDGEVEVAMSRAEVEQLPLLPHPQADLDSAAYTAMDAAFVRAGLTTVDAAEFRAAQRERGYLPLDGSDADPKPHD